MKGPYKPHYSSDGTYINSFGETPEQAIERYRSQAYDRHREERDRDRYDQQKKAAYLFPLTWNAFLHLIETKSWINPP